MSQLELALSNAIRERGPLLAKWHAESTDCYRLFHGVSEGRPGFSIDRFGSYLYLHSRQSPLEPHEIESCVKLLGLDSDLAGLPIYLRDPDKELIRLDEHDPSEETKGEGAPHIGQELGCRFDTGQDPDAKEPPFYLDFRAGRRALAEITDGAEVLNLFAYTCSAGVVAACHGAKLVWNVDVSKRYLARGRRNADLNDLVCGHDAAFRTIDANVLPCIRQLAGLSIPLRRGKRRSFRRFKPRQFDVILLDPPTFTKSPFGAVDILRDYPSLLKPCLLACRPGGKVIATHHSADQSMEEWTDIVERCAQKCGRPVKAIEQIIPDPDFPSYDGHHPLKTLLITV